ncbi:MAG: tetratricopeptide repeat protein [Patescibacteria group bacterium]|jgi:tetratricopeptide (TPR) repeat protein
MNYLKIFPKKYLLFGLSAVILLVLAGAVILSLKKPVEQFLPVLIDEATTQQINERIAKDLEMLKLFPNDYNVYMDLGNLENQLGHATRAIDYYHRAWEKIPTNSTPWQNIGNTYIQLGDYQKAEESFLQAKKANPGYYFTYFNLTKLYKDFLTNKADKIREVYLEGLKNTNNDYQLLQPFADYLVEIKNYSEAIEYLKVLVEKVPSGGRPQVIDRLNEVQALMDQTSS